MVLRYVLSDFFERWITIKELQKCGHVTGRVGIGERGREDAINCVKRSIVCDNQNWNLSYHDGTLKVCTYVQKIDYSKPNSQGWKCDFSAWQVT